MNNRHILLVEDNPDDEELTLLALDQSGIPYNVVVARDGVEALDYLFGTGRYTDRDINRLPAVVLLDIKMPRIDGLEVLQRLRANDLTKLLPVVILTTSTEEQDRLNGYSFGCNSYIRKPVDYVQFMTAVKQLGMYWLLFNEAPPLLGI
ncbi:response regulator [Coleofasciculus sp. FACHB-64]|uniref:response regulator n=1 Tax=Cyanophyceae TaxID=3028117 RepID=UPI00168208E8|nr:MULTISPECIES: response regulator [unclassified Coleofasciculus]MBD1841282.1 response regulator [Coleofasciculus sp. FACHB-501]MBD1878986.1 response regulator [Coleofasciculus sp. FACHB-T130]MBD1889107.1 response regulator [Coleofasciculus sp. FACHB-SPT9]MBD1893595.1 response regulator [Coleofasciculus sp. FACHB-129]MBD1901450.1 response regulator [Coleofasciculus sp. FACHB-125]